jgi:hypothetical protein
VQCQVIATNCVDKFLTAVDTDVALDTTTDLEGNSITPITEQTILLQGQEILFENQCNNNSGLDSDNLNCVSTNGATGNFLILPIRFPNTPINDIGEFNANGSNPAMIQKNSNAVLPWDDTTSPMSITASDWEDYMQFTEIYKPIPTNLNCLGDWATVLNLNGTVTVTPAFLCGTFNGDIIYKKYNKVTGTFITHGVINIVPSTSIAPLATTVFSFSVLDTNTIPISDDEILCLFIEFAFFNPSTPFCANIVIDVDYTGTNNFSMEQLSSCEETETKGYNVNSVFGFLPKVLSNDCFDITIGNYCLNDYSIANGLQIRNVLNPPPKLFTNWTDYFQNITKIFNIGWGFTSNQTELVIDLIAYFYTETIVVNVGSVNKIEFQNAQEFNYSLVNIGYSTWEAEEYSGLDEMNTSRQYRRNVSSFNKPIDLISNFIGAGYTIEITRRKNQALTGTSDWRFDDNIFIINTQNDEASTIAFRGVDSGALNIMSPATRMNYMITPARNLMRWFKSLCMNPDYTNDEFVFGSGNGNYIAQGRMEQECSFEDESISESQTIHSGNFIDQDNAKPLWKPLYMTFECPLTMAQQILISANPYGVIQANCNGTDYYGSIISCDYNPNEGTANFKLLQKIIYG